MPKRRTTRVASRAKPVLPAGTDDTNLEEEQRKERLEIYLKDFDIEVEKRVAEMRQMCKSLCMNIKSSGNMFIIKLNRNTKKMKQVDYFAQNSAMPAERVIAEFSKTVDEIVSTTFPQIMAASAPSTSQEPSQSVSTESDSDTSEAPSAKPTRSRKKATTTRKKAASTAKRASARNRTKAALQETPASKDNIKDNAFQTPASSSMSVMSTPFITPKFDPSKMTPASVRRAKKGELLVSLSGSPVEAKNSPREIDSVDKLKEDMENFFAQDRELDKVDRRNILMLQETLSKMLKETS